MEYINKNVIIFIYFYILTMRPTEKILIISKSRHFASICLKMNSPFIFTLKECMSYSNMYSMSYNQTSLFRKNVHLIDSRS